MTSRAITVRVSGALHTALRLRAQREQRPLSDLVEGLLYEAEFGDPAPVFEGCLPVLVAAALPYVSGPARGHLEAAVRASESAARGDPYVTIRRWEYQEAMADLSSLAAMRQKAGL